MILTLPYPSSEITYLYYIYFQNVFVKLTIREADKKRQLEKSMSYAQTRTGQRKSETSKKGSFQNSINLTFEFLIRQSKRGTYTLLCQSYYLIKKYVSGSQ